MGGVLELFFGRAVPETFFLGGRLFFEGYFEAVPSGLFCARCSRDTARGRAGADPEGGSRWRLRRWSRGRGGEGPLWGPAPGDSAAPEPTGLSTAPLAVRNRGSGQRGALPGVGHGHRGWMEPPVRGLGQDGALRAAHGERGRMETPGEAGVGG